MNWFRNTVHLIKLGLIYEPFQKKNFRVAIQTFFRRSILREFLLQKILSNNLNFSSLSSLKFQEHFRVYPGALRWFQICFRGFKAISGFQEVWKQFRGIHGTPLIPPSIAWTASETPCNTPEMYNKPPVP